MIAQRVRLGYNSIEMSRRSKSVTRREHWLNVHTWSDSVPQAPVLLRYILYWANAIEMFVDAGNSNELNGRVRPCIRTNSMKTTQSFCQLWVCGRDRAFSSLHRVHVEQMGKWKAFNLVMSMLWYLCVRRLLYIFLLLTPCVHPSTFNSPSWSTSC